MLWRNDYTVWSFNRLSINVILMWLQVVLFPNALLLLCILVKLLNSAVVWKTVTTNFFLVCISSFSSLILCCCCSAEGIWNIYQGIVYWIRNFYMVMLLAFEITFAIVSKTILWNSFFSFLLQSNIRVVFFDYSLLHQTDFKLLINVNMKAKWREISILPVFVWKPHLESPRHFVIISP